MPETLGSISTMQAVRKTYARNAVVVADGQTEVIDVRGAGGFAAYFAGGDSATATPVANAAGDALPGSSAAALTSGTRVAIAAHFYEFAATGGPVTVCVV
jgi:hypothetical protein